MLETNDELKSVFLRFLDALSTRDYSTAAHILSAGEVMRYVGSDDREDWSGADVKRAFAAHMEELPDYEFEVDVDTVEAFSSGSVGWGCARMSATFEGRQPVRLRHTAVYILEEGFWHAIQIHNSIGTRNEVVAGVALTNTLDELLAAMGEAEQAHLDEASSHGVATLVFTDIEDSTSMAMALGDDRWSEVIAWHDDVVQRSTSERGGTVIKTLGDGALLSFGSARAAAQAAISIQEEISGSDSPEAIAVRIGIHSGDVVLADGDVLGHTVNTAARVASAAAGGEIVASQAVYGMLADLPDFDFGATREVQLKGIARIHEITPLHW